MASDETLLVLVDPDLRRRSTTHRGMIRERLAVVEGSWSHDGRFVFEIDQPSPHYPPEQGGLIAEVDERHAPLIAYAPDDLRVLLSALDAVDARLDQESDNGTVPVAEVRDAIDRALDYRR